MAGIVREPSNCSLCGVAIRRYVTGYCRKCLPVARPCVMARSGCEGRVAAHSRSGICSRHASGQKNKMRGMARDQTGYR